MLNNLKDFLKIFKPKTFKKITLYLYHLSKRELYFLKKGKFKEGYNYFWARIFSIEEGLGLASPFYRLNPNLAPYPERIELEVTTKCRFRCPKCEHTYWNEPQEDMSFENFKRIIDQFPKLKAVSLTGIGHGFENPEYFKMLKYAKSKGLFVQFFDPLFLQNKEDFRKLIEIGVDWIWMSIDGATKETLEKSQVGSNFDKVTNNVKTLVGLKNKLGSPFPELHFQPIITKYNVQEMPRFVELINTLIAGTNQSLTEIQFIQLIPFKENEWLAPEITDDILEATQKKAREFKNLNVKLVRMSPQDFKAPINDCVAWTVPFITVDGTVYPCCSLTEGNIRHLIKPYTLGNVFKQDFKEIWHSEKFKNFRDMINKAKYPWLCCGPRECSLYSCKFQGCKECK